MSLPPPQGRSDAGRGAHLVLYDGVCGLCNRLLQFLSKHDHRDVFRFASLQSPMGKTMVVRWGGDPEDLATFYVIANFRTPEAPALTKADAGLFVVRELGWPWKLACVGRAFPKALRDRVYRVIARHRYRVLGRHDHCVVPNEESRRRFVD